MLISLWSQVFGLLFTLFRLYQRKPSLPYYIVQFWACLLINKSSPTISVSQKNNCPSLEKKSVPFQEVRDCMTVLMLNEQMSSICNDSHVKLLKILEPWLSYAFPTLPHPAWAACAPDVLFSPSPGL